MVIIVKGRDQYFRHFSLYQIWRKRGRRKMMSRWNCIWNAGGVKIDEQNKAARKEKKSKTVFWHDKGRERKIIVDQKRRGRWVAVKIALLKRFQIGKDSVFKTGYFKDKTGNFFWSCLPKSPTLPCPWW